MQKATSPKRKSFSRYAFVSAVIIGGSTLAAALAGVTPANAAELATQPDAQVMVFMVPLTLLVLAMLFEVARFALRGALPVQAPARTPLPRYWTPGRDEG